MEHLPISATVEVDPPRPVQVLYRGTWVDTDLDQWRRRYGRWQGHARYEAPAGVIHIAWRDHHLIRPQD